MKMKTKGDAVFEIINTVFLLSVCVLTVYPLIYTLSISLSSMAEAARTGLHLYPKEITFASYKMVVRPESFYRQYLNTVLRTVMGTVLGLLVTSMFAYAISRKKMPHRNILMKITLFTMLFSGGTIPAYLNIMNLGLIDSFWALILPCLISAYNVIIMRSFFMGIPESLIESAQIDGANDFRVFFSIVLPISKAVMATIGLWLAVMHWNAWFDAMLYINNPNKQVIQNLLRELIMENSTTFVDQGIVKTDVMDFTPETIKAATIIVTMLPILCVYPFVQRYFVKGVTIGAVKG